MKRKLSMKVFVMMLLISMFLFGCGSDEKEQEETVTDNETVHVLEIEENEEEQEEISEEESKEQEEVPEEELEESKPEVQKMLEDAEAEATALEKKLAEDASLTQADLNELTHEIYVVWDNVLNKLWGVLKDTQDKETMDSLLVEQREWIADKEAEAKKAGEEFAGGSMEAMAIDQKAAELTRERVYELAAYLGI